LGELAACWGLADVAFVGGSLTNRGGQNMLEPAGYGAAVVIGPNTWNFPDIVEQLLERDAAVVVHSPAQLSDALERLVSDEALRQEIGQAARDFVLTQQGATARTLAILEELLPADRPCMAA
jgi:3-deoxy-D-manno-octulosonic-acid transferase